MAYFVKLTKKIIGQMSQFCWMFFYFQYKALKKKSICGITKKENNNLKTGAN